jgi:SPP1 gp7 family putative phage head morphogenesis protein
MKRREAKRKARQLLTKRTVLRKKLKAVEALTKVYYEASQKQIGGVERERNSVFFTKEMKEAYAKAFNNNIDNKAVDFKQHVDFYNEGLLARTIKFMEDYGVSSNKFFDVGEEIMHAKEIFLPLMQRIFERHGQATMDAVANGFSEKASEQFHTYENMLLLIEQRADFFIMSMLDTDFKQMQGIIVDGLDQGFGVEEIGRNLRGYFDDMSVGRANTIARTETGRLISQSTNEAYQQSEVVTGKEWITADDSDVRDVAGTVNDHVINHGKIVATDGTFPNGEKYPSELTINCRCALAPAV